MQQITHETSQWRKLCRCLDVDPATTDAEDVLEMYGYHNPDPLPGFVRVDVARDCDAAELAHQIVAAQAMALLIAELDA